MSDPWFQRDYQSYWRPPPPLPPRRWPFVLLLLIASAIVGGLVAGVY